MRTRIVRTMVLFGVALPVFLATSGRAQETAARATPDSSSSRETAGSSKTKQKPSLLDATRVSTEEATKRAAQESAAKAGGATTVESPSDENVTEFHPTRQDSAQTSGEHVTTSGDSKKSVLKRVHGTVQGSATAGASGDRGGGAALGAASKSGKTAVYVETDHARRDSPH
jgi:hypothetical protein